MNITKKTSLLGKIETLALGQSAVFYIVDTDGHLSGNPGAALKVTTSKVVQIKQSVPSVNGGGFFVFVTHNNRDEYHEYSISDIRGGDR